jgi:hypothetical protein
MEWIKIEDRLPNNDSEVLIFWRNADDSFIENGAYYESRYDQDGKRWHNDLGHPNPPVTHWMKLPKPPKQ